MRCRSQDNLFGHFSSNYYQSICGESIFIKFHAFGIFFWTHLDGCVWSMRIYLWEASYFRYSNNIHTAKASRKNIWWNYNKNESCKRYLSNKEQKWMFLVVSRSDVHIDFDFAGPFFKVAHPKNRARKTKFV